MKQVYAPWLPQYQQSGDFHPFTGVSKPNGKETILIATEVGWVEEEGGPVVQDWAYEFMTQWGRSVPDVPLSIFAQKK